MLINSLIFVISPFDINASTNVNIIVEPSASLVAEIQKIRCQRENKVDFEHEIMMKNVKDIESEISIGTECRRNGCTKV